jgi:hypothetical protein
MLINVKLLTLLAASLSAASLFAGTFVLEIGRPSANPEAQAKHAVLVVRSASCAHPEKTNITANAEGIVNGKRRTIPLTLVSMSAAGTYAVTRQWPAEGKWVLTLVAANPDYQWHPSAIVSVSGDSADFAQVKRANQAPRGEEIEAALNAAVLAAKMQ